MQKLVRTTGRWAVGLATIFVIAVAIAPNLRPLFGPPPVQMPGGPRTTEGVSPGLEDNFFRIVGEARLHFVIQFDRELELREIEDIGHRLNINLDGPVPENAYITSASAEQWTDVRDALVAGKPRAVKIFEFIAADRLSPRLRDPNDPSEIVVPPYASTGPSMVAVYLRFFDDVPFEQQRDTLVDHFAQHPDGLDLSRSPTGIWAVILPEASLSLLSNIDEVRFIEPTMPPVVNDMDRAAGDVGVPALNLDGSGVVVAQWEGCQSTTLHPDMQNRVEPVGSISFMCRDWQFNDIGNDGEYDIGDPIGVDIDEDGTIDMLLHPAATPIPTGVMWSSMPMYSSGKYLYIQKGTQHEKVQAGDIRFVIDATNQTVTPTTVQISGGELSRYFFERHPTLVAGILVSNSQSMTTAGAPKYPGMLPAATVRSHAWRHSTVDNDYYNAIAHGARISSNSFGWEDDYHYELGADPYNTMSQFYDEVVSGIRQSGLPSGMPARMLIVGSSGNAGEHSEFWRTARIVNSAKNVIAVGNVSSSTMNTDPGVPADNSGRGPTMYGRLTPVLTAPGEQRKCEDDGSGLECKPDGDLGITSTLPPSGYGPAAGTSFSTPIVSGAAALLSKTYENTCGFAPAPQDLRALLVHSARDLTWAENFDEVATGTKLIGPDFVFGYGLLQVDDAVELVRHTVTEEIEGGWVEHRVLLNSTDQLVYVGGGWQLRVTLVWDDPPYYLEYPPREDTGILQNDIDLEIIDPEGRRYMPWVLDATPGYEADPATRKDRARNLYVLQEWRDHRNTIEQVVVDVPTILMNDTWTIRVREHAIRRGPQTYTLVSKVFDTLAGTDCGDFSNGSTVKIADPLDVPDTRLAWLLFWIAVIILIWLTFEALMWLYQTASTQYGVRVAILMVTFLLLLLFAIFRLLVMQQIFIAAILVLIGMAYVLWRALRP